MDDIEKNLWENLNEALYDARHELAMGHSAKYREFMSIAEKAIQALKVLKGVVGENPRPTTPPKKSK